MHPGTLEIVSMNPVTYTRPSVCLEISNPMIPYWEIWGTNCAVCPPTSECLCERTLRDQLVLLLIKNTSQQKEYARDSKPEDRGQFSQGAAQGRTPIGELRNLRSPYSFLILYLHFLKFEVTTILILNYAMV